MSSILTPAEQRGLDMVFGFAEDYDVFNIDVYNEIAGCSGAVLNEQYYNSNRNDLYIYQSQSDGIVMLNLMNRGPEDMTIMFYPTSRDGYRYVNIVYNYDESTIDDEWYEKKAFWYANVTITLYSTEEEYFQASTIEDLVLTPEENQRMNDFIDSFHQLIQTRKQEKKSYGKSTS